MPSFLLPLAIFLLLAVVAAVWHHQRQLRQRALMMHEAVRNRDFTFRLPTRGLLPGERAMQQALNQLGTLVQQQASQSEVEAWEQLTRILTHEMMNSLAPVVSISQSLLSHPAVKDTEFEEGVRAICSTSQHLTTFVASYRKLSQLQQPVITTVSVLPLVQGLAPLFPLLQWRVSISPELAVRADEGLLRQVLVNLATNAAEAGARTLVASAHKAEDGQAVLLVGNDGSPIPAACRSSLFVPFFTTKPQGSGIGLSLCRRIIVQLGGTLFLADQPRQGCTVNFVITLPKVEG